MWHLENFHFFPNCQLSTWIKINKWYKKKRPRRVSNSESIILIFIRFIAGGTTALIRDPPHKNTRDVEARGPGSLSWPHCAIWNRSESQTHTNRHAIHHDLPRKGEPRGLGVSHSCLVRGHDGESPWQSRHQVRLRSVRDALVNDVLAVGKTRLWAAWPLRSQPPTGLRSRSTAAIEVKGKRKYQPETVYVVNVGVMFIYSLSDPNGCRIPIIPHNAF